MADPVVLYDVDEKIGIVTLNRPEKLNAISPELQQGLLDAFARADADIVAAEGVPAAVRWRSAQFRE